jgi:phage terminase large subunit-like protein
LRESFAQGLTDEQAFLLLHSWGWWARPEQKIPYATMTPYGNPWAIWMIMAGRGWGKTQTGAQAVRRLVEYYGYHRIALVGDNAAEVRDVMVEGPSGLLASSAPWFMPKYTPSKRKVQWPNGAVAMCYSAEDFESLRGPQFDAAWCDEIAKWRYSQEAFDQLQFGLRLGRRPIQIMTTTPRPTDLVRQILKFKTTLLTRGRTADNLINLAPSFRETIVGRYEGTRLGRQELDAELLDDNPDALWSHRLIEEHRVLPVDVPPLGRTVIAVDPPATESGTCGIVAAGKDVDRDHAYVLGDYSIFGRSPENWAKEVIIAYHKHEADAVVAEVNQGGDMVSRVIHSVDSSIPVIQVRAYKGKWLRAEPVSMKYEQGKVHHVGCFPTLEDQMVQLTPENMVRGKSPDNLDAMVWALTDLLLNKHSNPRIRGL